jgi:hypothetical protein
LYWQIISAQQKLFAKNKEQKTKNKEQSTKQKAQSKKHKVGIAYGDAISSLRLGQ